MSLGSPKTIKSRKTSLFKEVNYSQIKIHRHFGVSINTIIIIINAKIIGDKDVNSSTRCRSEICSQTEEKIKQQSN